MISKAKIFFYSLFHPNKHIPKVDIPTNWYHKCLLVTIRRYKRSEIPASISYYDWRVAKDEMVYYLKKLRTIVIVISVCVACQAWRRKDVAEVQKDKQERIDQGLPLIPPYDMGGENELYNYNIKLPNNYFR